MRHDGVYFRSVIFTKIQKVKINEKSMAGGARSDDDTSHLLHGSCEWSRWGVQFRTSKQEHRFIINEITINPKSRTEEMMLQTGTGHARKAEERRKCGQRDSILW